MENLTFNHMINNLDEMISSGKEIELGYQQQNITTDLLVKARVLHGKMDKVLQNEVYHIIGMGNMTVGQNALFSMRIKELGKYRQVVKTVASLPENPTKIPNISASAYNSILTETTLKGDE